MPRGGHNRKPDWQHKLRGTYRQDRHGSANTMADAISCKSANHVASQSHEGYIEDDMDVVDVDKLTAGVDVPCDKRRLVAASSLEWVLDADSRTIHRWAASGLMPKPYRIGKSLRWDADELRDWIADGCPPLEKSED